MYRVMDETEILIRRMQDLRMVHFYNLAGKNASADGVLSVAVYYGENGQLNLSALDKHFDLLVEQIFCQYAEAENKKAIIADDDTRAILEHGVIEKKDGGWLKYLSMESVDEPKYQAISYFKGILIPIADYYLKQLYRMNGIEYKSFAYHFGWRGNCAIEAFVDKAVSKILIHVEMTDARNFTIIVSNFIKTGASIEFHITYGLDDITIHFSSAYWSMDGDSRYFFEDGKLMDASFVIMNGSPVYYDNVACEKVSGAASKFQRLEKLVGKIDDSTDCFLLPWGEVFACKTSGTSVRDYLYMLLDTNMGMLHEPFDCNGMCLMRGWSWRQIVNEEANIVVKTLAMSYDRLLTKDLEVQTYFLPAGANSYGEYKEKLQGRYFYEKLEDSVWGL